MEHDNEQALKPAKTDRLIQSIGELDDKISKLLAKREAFNAELTNTHNTKIIAIVRNVCKTPEEVSVFIKASEQPGFIAWLIEQMRHFEGTEGVNGSLEDDAGEVGSRR